MTGTHGRVELGLQHHGAGRLREAEALYREALAEDLVRGEPRIGMGSSQNRYELKALRFGAVASAMAWAAWILAAFLLWRRERRVAGA